MNTQNLLASMKAQEMNLELLIESLSAQKQAIIKNDYTSLEQIINNEWQILTNIKTEETNRLKTIKEIANGFAIELKENSIDDLIREGYTKLGKDLYEVINTKTSLKSKLQKVTNLNSQLKDVIEFSRGMIKETMLMLVGPNQPSLVNKRV